MLEDSPKSGPAWARAFEAIIHLPTLAGLAVVSVVLVWQLYGIGFEVGRQFVRLRSDQGNLTFFWDDGCCEIDW